MANDKTSLEGVEKSFFEKAWDMVWTVWNTIWWLVWDTWGGIKDTAEDIKDFSLIDKPLDMATNAYNRTKTFIDKSIHMDLDIFWTPFDNNIDTGSTNFTQDERNLSRTMNQIWAWEMIWDYWDWLTSVWWDYLSWGKYNQNLNSWVDGKIFDTNLLEFNTTREWLIKQQEDLYRDKSYKDLLDFNDRVRQEYLSSKWLTVIDDREDYNSFTASRFNKLSATDKSNLLKIEGNMNTKLIDTNAALESNEKAMKDYIWANMYGWYDAFEKINKEEWDKFIDNRTLQVQGQVFQMATDKVNNDIMNNTLSNIKKGSDILWFNDLKEAVIDNIATDTNYELSLLSMNDLEWNEELAKRARELNKVSYKMNIDFLNTYIAVKKWWDVKWLSEVEIKEKALKQVWDSRTENDKRLLREKEWFITGVSQFREMTQLWNRNFKLVNPMAYLDGFSYIWDTVQRAIDDAYDVEWADVPHYIKQETRNLIYANEGMRDKIASSFTYNSDALLSLAWWAWLTKATKIPAATTKFWNTLQKGIVKLDLNIAGKKWLATVIGNWVRGIIPSQIYWATMDPIIDNLMIEAPTKTIESFNILANALFDVVPLKFKWGRKLIANEISYRFMHDNKKEAVRDFVSLSKSKWINITKQEAIDTMENGIEWLYGTLFNPKEFTDKLNTKGWIYNMIKDHVVTMDKNQMKWLLTEGWYSLSKDYGKIMGVWIDDINSLKSNMASFVTQTDSLKKQLLSRQVNNLLDVHKSAFTVWQWFKWNTIDIKYAKDSWLVSIQWEANGIIDRLKSQLNQTSEWKYLSHIDVEDFNYNVDRLNALLEKAERRYWTKKFNDGITIKLKKNTPDIFIRYSDIKELDNKDLKDLVKEGKITFTTRDWKEFKDHIFKESWDTFISERVKSAIKNNQIEITEFMNKHQTSHDQFKEHIIKRKLHELISEWWTTKLDFLMWDANFNQEILDDFAKLTNNIMKDIVGEKHMKVDAVHINDMKWALDNDKDNLWMANGKVVLDRLKKMDTDFVLAYGSFYGNKQFKKDWKLTNAFYLTFGKWILDRPNISNSLDTLLTEKKWSISAFVNKTSQMKNEILSFAYNKGKFNIDEWIQRVNTIYTWVNPTDLFYEGKLDKGKTETLVKNLIPKSNRIKEVQEYVFDLFKDSPVTESLEPMMHNIIYKYDENKFLIENMMKHLDKPEFKQVFSDILLNSKTAAYMSAKIIKSKWLEKSGKLLWKARQKWNTYLKRLELDNKKLELERYKLNDFIHKYEWTDVKLTEFEDTIKNIDIRIDFNNKQMDQNDTSFLATQYTKDMADYMKAKVKDFTWLVDSLDKRISKADKEVINMQESLEQLQTKLKWVEWFTKEDKITLWLFNDKVRKMDFYTATKDQKDALLDEVAWFKPEVQEIANDIINFKNTKLNNHVYIEEDLEAILKWASEWNQYLRYEEVIENNPFMRYIQWFINNNDTNKLPWVTESIIDFFTKDKEIKELKVDYDINKTKETLNNLLIRHWWKPAASTAMWKWSKEILWSASYDIDKNLKDLKIWITKVKSTIWKVNIQKKIDILEKIKKDLPTKQVESKIKDVDDLYKYSEEFRDFIDWLYVTNIDSKWELKFWKDKWLDSNNEKINRWVQLNKLFSKLINDVELQVVKEWSNNPLPQSFIKWKLKDNLKKEQAKIIRLFKDYRNKSEYISEKWEPQYLNFWTEVMTGTFKQWKETINYTKTLNIEKTWWRFKRILQVDNMLKAEMDSKFFIVSDMKNFWFKKVSKYKEKETTQFYTLGWMISNHKKKILEDIAKEVDDVKKLDLWEKLLDLDSPVYSIQMFKRIMNWQVTTFDKEVLTKYKAPTEEQIRNKSPLVESFGSQEFIDWMLWQTSLKKMQDDWYIYWWNFGDKDAVYQFYKAPEDLMNKITKWKSEFSEWIYEYEYAYSNWLVNNDATYNKFTEFTEAILEHLKSGKTFESFKKEIEADDKFFKNDTSTSINTTKDIKKREASTMSNYSTFDDVDKPVTTYILEEDYDVPKFIQSRIGTKQWADELWKDYIKRVEKIIDDWSEAHITDLLEWSYIWIEKQYVDILKVYKQEWNTKKLKEAIKSAFVNDNEDGTSYASRELAIMRWKINWMWDKAEIQKLMDDWIYNEFKDHFYWDHEWKRFLGKSLINVVKKLTSTDESVVTNNTVLIWASSMKLKWWYKAFDKPKFIMLNWRKRRILWEVQWTTTQYFKNASTDVFKEKEWQTVSDSIKSALTMASAMKINAIQKTKIKEAFESFLWILWTDESKSDIFSEIDRRINQLIEKGWMWLWSNSVLNARLKDFLTEVSQIINKPKDSWQSMFINKSTTLIGPNEMLVSNKSNIYKQVLEDASHTLFNIGSSELNPKQLKKVKANLYSVWFRYPVPSKYNTWVYKFRIIEDELEHLDNLKSDKKLDEADRRNWLYEYKWLSAHAVVSNPFSTYLKLEWDNDGDHLFFVSAFKKLWKEDTMWEVLATELLNDSKISVKNFAEALSEWKDTWRIGDFNNKFIVADQVDKDSKSEVVTSLIESRTSALDAKNRIWNVSATGRTIKNLLQMQEAGSKQSDTNLIKFSMEEWDPNLNQYPFSQIVEWEQVVRNWKTVTLKWKLKPASEEFYEKYSSLLQLTLDFWNSDKAKFDKYWYVDLVWDLLNKTKKEIEWKLEYSLKDKLKIHEFMTLNITPLAMMYKKSTNVWATDVKIVSEWKWFTNSNSVIKNKLHPLTWSTRLLMEDFYKTYWRVITSINEQNNIKWINDNIFTINWKPTAFKKLYNKEFWKEVEVWGKADLDVPYFSKYNKEYIDKWMLRIIKWTETKPWIENKVLIKAEKWDYTFYNYIDNIIALETKEGKEKYKDLEKLYSEKAIDALVKLKDSKEWRLYYEAAVMFSLARWEFKILNLLTNKDKLYNLVFANKDYNTKLVDINQQLKDADFKVKHLENITEPTVISQKKYNAEFDEIYNADLKTVDTTELNAEIEVKKWNLKDKEVELLSLTNDRKVSKEFDDKDIMKWTTEDISYTLPEITTELTDGNKDTMYKVLWDIENQVVQTKRIMALRISTLVEEYAPFMLKAYNSINDFMNIWKSISDANEEHIKHFSWSFLLKSKTWIWVKLREYNIKDQKELAKKIQFELMSYKEWEYWVAELDEIVLEKMKHHFDMIPKNLVEKLFKDEWFINALKDYQDKVIIPVSTKLNWLEAIWYKIHSNYKDAKKYSVVIDALESHKWDAQLSLKLLWIDTEKAFDIKLMESWASESQRNILKAVLYKWQMKFWEKMVQFLKSVHYQMTYWAWSIFTWNGIWAALSQFTPNAIEIKAYFNNHYDESIDAMKLMSQHNLLGSESVKEFWTWWWKDLNDWSLVNDIWSKAEKILWVRNHPKSKEASKMLHMVVTNPLWAWDYPLENMRKIVAISKVLNLLKIDNIAQFNRKVQMHWDEYLWMFRHKIREEFADSGGWVVSSSGIYRDTIFTHANHYYDNFVTRFFTQTMWYLMWWSYHKMAVWIERELGFVSAITSLKKWDYKGFKMYMDDWFAYNSLVTKNLMYTTWLYLKLEKYENNPNSHVSIWEFQRWFNNQIVALEILLDRHIKNWNVSWELWWDIWDRIWFTTYWMIAHSLRLFKQPQYAKTMFDHHAMELSLWNEVTWQESFKFALEQHYTGYMKYNGLELASDVYNTNQYNSVVNIMWVWWKDAEDILLDQMTQKSFSRFQDKWFFKALYKLWEWLHPFKPSEEGWFAITTEITRQLHEVIMDDPELQSLVSWWEIWEWENDYNLSNLIWNKWDELTQETHDIIEQLFYKVANYWFQQKDDLWDKLSDEKDSKQSLKYRELVESALKKNWTSLDEVMKLVKTDKTQLLWALAYLESEHDIPNIIPLSLFLQSEKANYAKEYKEEHWEVGDEWYKKLEWSQWQEVERDILLKYQDYLNLNGDIVFEVIEQHINVNNKDVLEKLEEKFDDTKFSKYSLYDLVNSSYLIWQNITEDTNVSKLHSRYALASRWIWEWETAVKLMNKFLQWVDDLHFLSWKAKTANKAAMIMWMSKANFNLLTNDEEFNKLTEDSKKLLVNRTYKTSKEWIDFDSSMYLNSVNKAAYGKSNMYFPKYRSPSQSWWRPNFSKQFAPLQKAMENKSQYLAPDTNKYLRDYNSWLPSYATFPINNQTFKTKQQYDSLLMKQLFYWYKSKWIIKTYSTGKKVDFKAKTSIKLKKPKKSKATNTKTNTVTAQPKPVKKWLNPTLPLSMSWGE